MLFAETTAQQRVVAYRNRQVLSAGIALADVPALTRSHDQRFHRLRFGAHAQ